MKFSRSARKAEPDPFPLLEESNLSRSPLRQKPGGRISHDRRTPLAGGRADLLGLGGIKPERAGCGVPGFLVGRLAGAMTFRCCRRSWPARCLARRRRSSSFAFLAFLSLFSSELPTRFQSIESALRRPHCSISLSTILGSTFAARPRRTTVSLTPRRPAAANAEPISRRRLLVVGVRNSSSSN